MSSIERITGPRGDVMSEWITDRRPTNEDAHWAGFVWNSIGKATMIEDINFGEPWMPIIPPDPYVKPKRWRAEWVDNAQRNLIWEPMWAMTDGRGYYARLPIPAIKDDKHREAAGRIVEIVNEVNP